MAGRWSTEHFVKEFKDLQASAMAVDCLGNWALLAGERNRKYYAEKKSKGMRRRSTDCATPSKRPKDMTEKELRQHKSELRKNRIARMSHQKKLALKKKNALRMRLARETEKAEKEKKSGLKVVVSSLTRLPKKIYNLTSELKQQLKKKTGSDPDTYGRVVKNLANPRTPEKRAAVKTALNGNRTTKTSRKKLFTRPKRTLSGNLGKKKRSAMRKSARNLKHRVKMFYLRSDVSRILPHKRYSTKHGPGYVMVMTIKAAHRLFQAETNESISLSWFAQHRPRNVRKLEEVPVETCLCVCCTNVRYKLNALRRVSKMDLQSETDVLDFVLCPKRGSQRWHKADCIHGKCMRCSDRLRPFVIQLRDNLETPVTWLHWERKPTEEGKMKLDVQAKKGDVMDCLEELQKDLEAPIKGTSFFQHLFTAFWQYSQYKLLKRTLKPGQVMLIMDFAENRKALYHSEVKSAHFGKGQITLHPIVAFFKGDEEDDLRRHALMFLSDDCTHDHHAVQHFTIMSLQELRRITVVNSVVIWSDGCASQYKGKGTFADLSLTSEEIQRCYFGSEHGKGEADGETGVLSQAMARQQRSGRNFRHAKDVFEWARQELEVSDGQKTRSFILVENGAINRDRPGTSVTTLPGTRSLHQVVRAANYVLKARKLACFCDGCQHGQTDLCINGEWVGPFDTFKLKPSQPVPEELNEAFVAEPSPTEEAEPDRKNMAFVDLSRPDDSVFKVTRQSKWDIGCVQWNGHASHAHRFVTACNQRLDVLDFREASASHLCSLKAHSRTVSDVDWSPFDVNIVASCSVDTFTYFWDVRDSKKPVKSFQTVSGAYQVKWNKVTNNLFATTHDGDVRIWDPRKGNTPVQYISAHSSKIHGLDWSHTDQHRLVTASQDCTIRFWDYNNPRRSEAIINSGNPVWRARFTPFGDGVVSVVVPQLRRGENSLSLWHVGNQQSPVHTFMGHKDVILEFQWRKQQDGARDYHLVTWSKDQSLRIWKVDPAMQKSCGHEIDELTNGLLEDEELLSPHSIVTTYDNFGPSSGKEAKHHHSDNFTASGASSLKRGGGVVTSGGVGGSTAGQSGQSSSMLPVLSLEQEIDEIMGRIPGVKLDQADIVKRTCSFKLSKGQNFIDIELMFPHEYPIKISPSITVTQHNLDGDTLTRLTKTFADTCTKHVKQHVNCVEPCIRQILHILEKAGASGMVADSTQHHEDRKALLEKKYTVEKVRSPTTPVQQNNVIPMYPTGSFQDSCIPFPRTCGATFCSNDRLVVFGVPVAMKKVHEDNEVTPRALSDLVSYTLSQSQWMRSQSNSFAPMSLFYGSPPHTVPDGISISSFYTEKTTKNRHRTSHHHHHKSHGRSRDSGENKREREREVDKVSKRMQKVGSIKVYDISSINPVSKFLAENYKLDLEDIPGTCEHNAAVAKKLGRKDLIQIWQLVAQMSHPSLRPSPNVDHGPPWAYCPFGRPLVNRMLNHYAKMHDVQTMAMICCMFWDKDRPQRDLMPAMTVATLPRNESRTSFEYAAANQYNPYHTVSSMTNLLKGWTSISKSNSTPAATTSTTNFTSGPISSHVPLKPHQQQQQQQLQQVQTHPSAPPPPPPYTTSSSSSSSSTSATSSTAKVSGRSMAEVASQPNLAALFRAGRGKRGRSAAVMKNKRSLSWSESYDDFKMMEDKDPREREVERERILHHNNSKMLDPEQRSQHESIKKAYAHVLFKWGLLNQRTQLLKHTDNVEADNRGIEFAVACYNCAEDVRGVQCNRCKYPALKCSVCHIGVRGAANLCMACGHGGHTAHMMDWFSAQSVCPSGCGCCCLQENALCSGQ